MAEGAGDERGAGVRGMGEGEGRQLTRANADGDAICRSHVTCPRRDTAAIEVSRDLHR